MSRKLTIHSRPTAQQLVDDFPVIHQGQYDNLHYHDDGVKFWLARTTKADGERWDNTITIEVLRDGKWISMPRSGYDGGPLREEDES